MDPSDNDRTPEEAVDRNLGTSDDALDNALADRALEAEEAEHVAAALAGSGPDPEPGADPEPDALVLDSLVLDSPVLDSPVLDSPVDGVPDGTEPVVPYVPPEFEASEALAGDLDPVEVRPLWRTILSWVGIAIIGLLGALTVRIFIAEAFFIPSESMEPTLSEGDRIVVTKIFFDISDLKRADVVVFERPDYIPGKEKHIVKRVVALPGETIEFKEGRVWIDGDRINEPYTSRKRTDRPRRAPEFCEDASRNSCTIPEGHVFVMGDNRDPNGSLDSRSFGPIDADLIIGEVKVQFWPLNDIGIR